MGRSLILLGALAVMTRGASARPTVNVAVPEEDWRRAEQLKADFVYERLEDVDVPCLRYNIDAILEAHNTYKTYMEATMTECLQDNDHIPAVLDDFTWSAVLEDYTWSAIEEDPLYKCFNDDYCLQFYYDAKDAMEEVVRTYVARNIDRTASLKREGDRGSVR